MVDVNHDMGGSAQLYISLYIFHSRHQKTTPSSPTSHTTTSTCPTTVTKALYITTRANANAATKKQLKGEREIDRVVEREKTKNPSKIPCIRLLRPILQEPPLLSLSLFLFLFTSLAQDFLPDRRNYGLAPNASSSALTPSSVLIFFN